MPRIKYVVGNKEFKTEEEAKTYLNTLEEKNSKFKFGETVYYKNDHGMLEKRVITDLSYKFGKKYYSFKDLEFRSTGAYEENIYRTPEDYFNYIKMNIVE